MFKQVLFSVFVILLIGCGGGGSTVPGPVRPAVLPGIPLQKPAQAARAPITDFDGSPHVGARVSSPKDRPAGAGAHNGVSVSSGLLRDGVVGLAPAPGIPLQNPAHALQAPITDLDGSLYIGPELPRRGLSLRERAYTTGFPFRLVCCGMASGLRPSWTICMI